MIHVKQFAKQKLMVVDKHQVLQMGRKYTRQWKADRRFAPWEKKAYREDNGLVKRCKEPAELPVVAARKTDRENALLQKKRKVAFPTY